MPDSQSGQFEPSPSILSRKLSDSPLTDHSDHESSNSFKIDLSLPFDCQLRTQIYQQIQPTCSLSDRMNKRGISWLVTVSWSKGFSQICLWTAIELYYAYKARFPLQKEEMQAIILVSLQLSSKFHESTPLETRDLMLLLSKPTSRQALSTYQERILLITDFNLLIPHYLFCLNDILSAEQAAKVHFLCELLMLRDYHIFFDKEKVQRLVKMIMHGQELSEQETTDLKELMNDKQSRILHHKYSNHFDTQVFMNSF